jgi:nicotinate-nucleotide pyrophosphorylase (carboxylating)
VLAGAWVVHIVFRRVDPSVEVKWLMDDGEAVVRGQTIAVASGPARSILVAERVALNFMQRMSGIASLAAAMVAAVASTAATVLDTRKTAPGLRLLDKWAVKVGGAANHRMGLYDMVMIKDNHVAAAGGIGAAVAAAESFMRGKGIRRPLEVETRTLGEVAETLVILDSQPDSMITRIMLDNMTRRDDLAPCGLDVATLQEALRSALAGEAVGMPAGEEAA